MNSSFVYRNISLLYRSLEEIQKNMGFVARRGNAFLDNRRANASDRVYTINADQRFMIETYKEMYNTILQHIEFLYSQLMHAPQQYNPNYQNQRPSNLFYFNGHYYTIDHTAPVNTNGATPLEPQTHLPSYGTTPLRSAGSAIPPPPRHPAPVRTPRTFPRAIISRSIGNFNDPVNVVATPRQISTATTQLLYENIETPTNDRCPICLEVFQPNSEVTQINNCRHIFNRTELATWFQTNVRCPVCRFDIRDHVDVPPPPVTSSTSTEPINNTPFAQTPIADPNSDAASMSTLNSQLTSIMDTLTNQALQNMFDDNATSQILANLFNNNIDNLTFDPSANAFTFDTYLSGRP
jgi:hypothetical protein